MANFNLTAEQIASYQRDGYLIVKNFLRNEEIKKTPGHRI